MKNENQIVVIINHESPIDSKIDSFCQKVLDNLAKHLAVVAAIGVGKSYLSIKDLPKSYFESHSAVMQKILLGSNKVIHISQVPDSNLVTFSLSENEKLLLTSYINAQNLENAYALIDNLFTMIQTKGLSYINIKALCIEVSILLGKMVNEFNGSWEKIFSNNIFSESHLESYKTLDEIKRWMKNSVRSLCSYLVEIRKSDGKRAIDEIKDYISNYYYTDINLNDLANRYFINASYLSQLFKSEVGYKFIDYITQIRVEKAKELLSKTTLRSYEIAEMVGYNDPRYFSDVFSKHVGVTPSKYREQHCIQSTSAPR